MERNIEHNYKLVKEIVLRHEINQCVKNYVKEKGILNTYLEIGKIINEVDKVYGKSIIKEYSNRLTIEIGKKYTPSLLYKISQFYNIIKKVPTLSGKLTWSHWYEMLSIKATQKIIYYVSQCEKNNLDVRSLRRLIKQKEYERLDDDTKNKMTNDAMTDVADYVKNPILIKSICNYKIITEKILQKLILEDISTFMKELGSGFSFIDSEYKIKLGFNYNYIDLLLYNINFDCYVVVELKTTELKKDHIGQIHIYMNYIDTNLKKLIKVTQLD